MRNEWLSCLVGRTLVDVWQVWAIDPLADGEYELPDVVFETSTGLVHVHSDLDRKTAEVIATKDSVVPVGDFDGVRRITKRVDVGAPFEIGRVHYVETGTADPIREPAERAGFFLADSTKRLRVGVWLHYEEFHVGRDDVVWPHLAALVPLRPWVRVSS